MLSRRVLTTERRSPSRAQRPPLSLPRPKSGVRAAAREAALVSVLDDEAARAAVAAKLDIKARLAGLSASGKATRQATLAAEGAGTGSAETWIERAGAEAAARLTQRKPSKAERRATRDAQKAATKAKQDQKKRLYGSDALHEAGAVEHEATAEEGWIFMVSKNASAAVLPQFFEENDPETSSDEEVRSMTDARVACCR